MGHREEVSKEEEKITSRGHEGRQVETEGVQKVLELLVSQAQMKQKEANKEKKKAAGWSTERVKEDRSKRDFLRHG